jgi:flagellar assembly protein FliH
MTEPERDRQNPSGRRTGSAYTRFIPREELGSFTAWRPDALGGSPGAASPGAAAAASPAADAPPTHEALRAQVAAARQAGYQDGYRDGLAALESFKQGVASQAAAQVGALLQGMDQQFQALDQRLAETLSRCALELARQVLRHELRTHPELVARVAGEAVASMLHSARHITVQVHPQDLPLVAEGAGEILAARGARLQASATVDRGGVLVESDMGAIDARIASRWTLAARSFGNAAPWAAAARQADGTDPAASPDADPEA